ncbi:inositol monophosphatase family protein [Tamlana sp. 2201CG12-4]|uniref:3'(2'),5'-bisphosphate nucleotidase CysQ family protein n=1 Tax=Tamlana sp. 2201CG12-4 TaxID=3112582 RepID=UPI002DBC5E4E|nr:inositol monophosphatase family protein [Tamlana sp. 2201CG12-4]MEC3908410.1 inositol monophosphatase family protein [Tamlana sp. 2201CG12-4]
MTLNPNHLTSLSKLAIQAAKSAGALISSYKDQHITILKKESGNSQASQVVTEVDFKSQELILNILQPSIDQYDLGILTEESNNSKNRLTKDFFWCIDPLDGTLPFTESVPGYAVSIALVKANGEPQIGVVYDPITQNLYHAIINKGAYKNEVSWHLPPADNKKPLQFYFNRSFETLDCFSDVLTELNKTVKGKYANGINSTPSYGAVMNACSALETVPSCFFAFPKNTAGGGSTWDYAATACIYKEIGASVSDMFGNPLQLNQPHTTFMNEAGILFASNTNLSESIQKMFKLYFY